MVARHSVVYCELSRRNYFSVSVNSHLINISVEPVPYMKSGIQRSICVQSHDLVAGRSIEIGKLADICIWDPAFFGVKPDVVLKSGTIAAAIMGDPNASIPTPQPDYYRPMFGAFGRSLTESSVTFVSQALLQNGETLGLAKKLLPVSNTRKIGKRSMILNSATPRMEVNPETYEVRADGRLLTCEPAKVLPMTQRYFMY